MPANRSENSAEAPSRWRLALRGVVAIGISTMAIAATAQQPLDGTTFPPPGSTSYEEIPWPSVVPSEMSYDGSFASPPNGLPPLAPEYSYGQNSAVEAYGSIVPAPVYPGFGEPHLDPPLDPRTLERMAELASPDPLSIEAPFFYRANSSAWRFVARGQAGFADASWENDPFIEPSQHGGFGLGLAVRFLEGPLQPDLNPRLYDFQAAYQHRAMLLNGWSFDVAGSIGFFSDFDASVRDGVRFPGHAVLSAPIGPRARWVLGGEYLDRDDIAWLPVGGLRWEPNPDLQVHLEFPRPMIRWLRDGTRAYYVRAELGGGTWDVRQQSGIDDVLTYREIDIFFGSETISPEGNKAFEIGYATGRRLDYRSGTPSAELPDAWVFRFVDRF